MGGLERMPGGSLATFGTLTNAAFFLKDLIAAAQYWHDPLNNTNYAQGPPVLPNLNKF